MFQFSAPSLYLNLLSWSTSISHVSVIGTVTVYTVTPSAWLSRLLPRHDVQTVPPPCLRVDCSPALFESRLLLCLVGVYAACTQSGNGYQSTVPVHCDIARCVHILGSHQFVSGHLITMLGVAHYATIHVPLTC